MSISSTSSPSRNASRPASSASRRSARSTATTCCAPATSSRSATPPTPSTLRRDRQRPKRVENGQDGDRRIRRPRAGHAHAAAARARQPSPGWSRSTKPGCAPKHAAGNRAAAVRLNYAMHSFPAQGATVHGTATLAGHWSQAKQETYVGDTRAIYRHTVHVAREDLGTRRHRRGPRRTLRAADLREPPAPREHPPDARPGPQARRRRARKAPDPDPGSLARGPGPKRPFTRNAALRRTDCARALRPRGASAGRTTQRRQSTTAAGVLAAANKRTGTGRPCPALPADHRTHNEPVVESPRAHPIRPAASRTALNDARRSFAGPRALAQSSSGGADTAGKA